jgi:adenylate kinase
LNSLDFQNLRSAQGKFRTPRFKSTWFQPRTVILLGPPGAGKGTQAQRIAGQCGLKHLSTGDMLRDNIYRDTELAKKAKPLINRGELVPDEIVLGMVKERIAQPDCKNGFILDGFPRTLRQAQGLEEICVPHKSKAATVLNFAVKAELLVRRLINRRICNKCGHIYNLIEHPPEHSGICDLDGSELLQRADDAEEVVRERICTYERHTRPLIDYYAAKGVLHEVEGTSDPDAVTASILKVLNK